VRVRATLRMRRSSALSTQLTKSFATRRSTAMMEQDFQPAEIRVAKSSSFDSRCRVARQARIAFNITSQTCDVCAGR
jgi:hypothetical protein